MTIKMIRMGETSQFMAGMREITLNIWRSYFS